MRKSALAPGGQNLFQVIKSLSKAAQDEGLQLIKLSIGQPCGPALEVARIAAAQAIMSDQESMHEYQDNGSPGIPDFAKQFVQAHVAVDLDSLPPNTVDYLPIPGIKPMLGIVINACGAWDRNMRPPDQGDLKVVTMTAPGYPTPRDQALMAKRVMHFDAPMSQRDGFLFDITTALNGNWLSEGDLIMLNLPHNPTGITASVEWLSNLCAFCEKRGIRIFNDAAYAILTHDSTAVTLTEVAVNFPNLNWAEAFSASKAGNFTGWRVGAIVGSPEFVADIKTIKGNTDSGFNAALAAGVLYTFQEHMPLIQGVRTTYANRLSILDDVLQSAGMRPAVAPRAGFFSLYDCPKRAFGEEVQNSMHFTELMIKRAPNPIVTVPFNPWVRFAVCYSPVEEYVEQIRQSFEAANVSYNDAVVSLPPG